jgi:hypothetical protein
MDLGWLFIYGMAGKKWREKNGGKILAGKKMTGA